MRSSVVLPLAVLMVAATVLASAALRDEGGAAPAIDTAAPAPVDPPVVLIRSGRRVTPEWARRADAVPGVESVAYVRRGQTMLRRATDADGRVVQTVRAGYGIPVDTLVADVREYASMLPGPAASVVARLRPGEAILSSSAALVRGVDDGGVLAMSGGRLRVAAVVEDPILNGAEMLIARPDAGIQLRAALVLARIADPGAKPLVERAFARDRANVIWRGYPYGTRAGPIVQPKDLKARFGEVAARLPFAPDWVRLDPEWVRRNIVKRRVPILGVVRCNRVVVPRLRGALGELSERGLSRLVDRHEFAGCFAPRRIPATGALSLHALGLAVDVNARSNPYDGPNRQDPRLVETMRRWGFTWGGDWPTVGDPMHFEWQGGG